jgi:hypothetical protein
MQPTSCLLDGHIREALKITLREQDHTGAIIEEMPLLRGRGRADLAFVNGKLYGFEIKSEADSLIRLGMQTENYEAIFEFNTIVAAAKHLALARERLPRTWGIIEARQVDSRVELFPLRRALRNHNINNSALARLLWKNECLLILRKAGFRIRPTMPVIELWNLAESMNTRKLCQVVKEALKRRQTKAAQLQIPYDGLHTTVATE